MLAKLNQNGNPLLAWKFSVLPWRTVHLHIPTCKFYALSSKFEHNWERKCTGSVAHISGVDPFSGSAWKFRWVGCKMWNCMGDLHLQIHCWRTWGEGAGYLFRKSLRNEKASSYETYFVVLHLLQGMAMQFVAREQGVRVVLVGPPPAPHPVMQFWLFCNTCRFIPTVVVFGRSNVKVPSGVAACL